MTEISIHIKVAADGECWATLHIDGEHKKTAVGDALGDVLQLLELDSL